MHITKLALQSLSNYIFTITITSSIFIILLLLLLFYFIFLGWGVNFCHLTTKKKSNATHTKDFCGKKKLQNKAAIFQDNVFRNRHLWKSLFPGSCSARTQEQCY